MKTIYIVLTHTGTILSNIIKTYTKDEFSHVSISLDEELNDMYSFGRLHPYNPFWGGFVKEDIYSGTFKRFRKTKTAIFAVSVTEEQYMRIYYQIQQVQRENYDFNVIGLFAIGFQKRIEMQHSFYCAEFVKYVLEQSGIPTNTPDMVRPEDFKQMPGITQVYSGLLRNYPIAKKQRTTALKNALLVATTSVKEKHV